MRSRALNRWLIAATAGSMILALGLPALAHEGGGGGEGDPEGPTSPELELIGSYSPFGGHPVLNAGLTTDVWAHGNYAYIGSFDEPICSLDLTGIRIIDISDPTDPALAAFVPAKPGTRNNDVKVAHLETKHFSGDIMVASNEPCGNGFLPRLTGAGVGFIPGQGGVSIWDVTNPRKPRPLKQNFVSDPIHNSFIWQDGDRAYMMFVSDVAVRDVLIADITKPQAPKLIAAVGGPDWPDLSVNIPGGAAFLHDMWVQDGIAYLSYWDAGMVMLDVSDPRNPVYMGDSDYLDPDPLSEKAPAGDGHVSVPSADGNFVLFGDEDFAPGSLTSFSYDGTPYDAVEAAFTTPVYTLPGKSFSGEVVWTGGVGCEASDIPDATDDGQIALIQRGVCFFSDKAHWAQEAGYDGFIVANDAARGDTLITMASGGDFADDTGVIPGFFVGYSTGEAMKADIGKTAAMTGEFDGWGYLRILDVTDPSDIEEVGQYATENVFTNPPPPGDYTMHNVVVDTGTTAYISWYADGMRVVDFSDPTDPTEIWHYKDEEHGSNYWGVYLHTLPSGEQLILGSDRDKGLHIFADPVETP